MDLFEVAEGFAASQQRQALQLVMAAAHFSKLYAGHPVHEHHKDINLSLIKLLTSIRSILKKA